MSNTSERPPLIIPTIMNKMFLFLAVVSFALTMSAKNQFTEISANGDTIQLFGYANIVKVKKCKYETFVSCTNTFFNKKNEHAYIVPGLGDAGDLCFGVKD